MMIISEDLNRSPHDFRVVSMPTIHRPFLYKALSKFQTNDEKIQEHRLNDRMADSLS